MLFQIHCSYGDELGLSSDDEDYIAPDDLAGCRSIDIRRLTEVGSEHSTVYTVSSVQGGMEGAPSGTCGSEDLFPGRDCLQRALN